jgi:coenzyme F420-reducing hydrogenase beta subunit
VEKLLFIGVGCQVQALRSVEKYLPVKQLYVLGTNCVDNGRREGLDKFLRAASATPTTALHYEFMQVCCASSPLTVTCCTTHSCRCAPRSLLPSALATL